MKRILRRLGRNGLIAGMGLLLLNAIASSGTQVKALEAGCADYACAADDECKNHSCDACGTDKRCLKAPEEG